MNPTEPKTLATLDGNTLKAREFAPLRFTVDKILPHGLFIIPDTNILVALQPL
jgi:hypothetical protein